MDMHEFYKKYNIGRERFASLFGSSARSMYKYENNDPTLRASTRLRIEKAILTIEKYDLVHPEPLHNFEPIFSALYCKLNRTQHEDYVRTFKEYYVRELMS